jgi:hypothetical protein
LGEIKAEGNNSRSLHNYGYSARLDGLLDSERNLLGQSLLHLEPPTEHFGNTCELGQAQDELVLPGDVSDRDLWSL